MQNDIAGIKKEIRNRLISIRNELDANWIKDRSIQIEERLFRDKDFLENGNILFYDAFEKEVQTEGMIKRALSMKKRVFLPVTDFNNLKLLISDISGGKESAEIASEDEVEMVIVPGIAFSESGARIGFGMGFYDRFLSRLSPEVKTIGLAFDFQIVNEIPVCSHDFIINKIITEKRVIDCHKDRG
ncbi:MAG: 5-formyltetrahydrofolate cyclo-ligase [Nitrospinae bacterium]|nr:5-formyltetrahydrofolate cyclo-ligase [Nitrospinota bacterium]